jgi:hypothetical protein
MRVLERGIKEAFPSAKIIRWETIYMYHSEKHRLQHCEVMITNLEEIKKIGDALKSDLVDA